MSKRELRDELVQVGAVAAAIIHDLDHGSTQGKYPDEDWMDWSDEAHFILEDDMLIERMHQEDKWGPQHHHPAIWLLILTEEIGEAADEVDLKDIESPQVRAYVRAVRNLGLDVQAFLDEEVFPKDEGV